jgi:cytochrome P450
LVFCLILLHFLTFEGEGFDSLWMADTFHKLGDAFGTLMMWSFLLGPTAASWLPLPFNIRRRKLKSQVVAKVEKLIEKRKEQLKNSDDVPADLISILLTAPSQVPTSVIADEALTFLIAGADTVSAVTVRA